MSYQSYIVVWQYLLIVTFFVVLFVPSAFADESYSFNFQPGTLKFDTDLEDISCNDVSPVPKIGTATSFDIDGMDDHFFIFLSKTNSNIHQYLQIKIPDEKEKGADSYLINFIKDGELKSRQLYQGYGQMSVYMITDSEEKKVTDKKYKQFLTGDSLKVSPHSLTYPPGEYDFHSILFQSDKTSFVDDEVCAISLHWNVYVDNSGNITAEEPSFTVGRVYLSEESDTSSKPTQNTEQESSYLAIGETQKKVDGIHGVGTVNIFDMSTGSLIQTINNPEGNVSGGFGKSILYHNDKIIISAPWQNNDHNQSKGAIYIMDGKTGSLLTAINNPEFNGSGEFGISIAAVGDKLIVGSPQQTVNGVSAAGSVYIFDINSGSLIQTISNPNPLEQSNFGNSVTSLNKKFAVGVPGLDLNDKDRVGAVLIFDINSGSLIQTISNPEPDSREQFGYVITSKENLLLVGAPSRTVDGKISAGAAYLFDGETGLLLHMIDNPEPDGNTHFGISLLVAENKIVAGANRAGLFNEGVVYVFDKDSGMLLEILNHPDRDGKRSSLSNDFGHSLAYSDGKLVIGDGEKTINGKISAGAVYVFDTAEYSLLDTIPNPNPDVSSSDLFGTTVTFVGDFMYSETSKMFESSTNETKKMSSLDESKTMTDIKQTNEPKSEISNFTTGTVEWVDSKPFLGGYGIVKITDPDMNKNYKLVDIFKAKAWSTTDKQGIELDMIETDRDTGIFYIDIEFSSKKSTIQTLETSLGDVITVSYLDSTTPNGQDLELIDTIVISQPPHPQKQLELGISPENILCKDGMELISKQSDNSPVCVTTDTKDKLLERGWAETQTKNFATSADSQKLLSLLETGRVEEFNKLKASLIMPSNPFLSLNGTNLQGLDLRGIDLTKVHIAGTDMQNATLQGIVLDYKNIKDTNLQGADLTGADLSDAWLLNVNLQNVNMQNTNLKNMHMGDSNIAHANFMGADLRGIHFQVVSMVDTNFEDANMQGTNLSETNLNNLNFQGADLQFAHLQHATLSNANLKNTNLSNANLENANLREADLSGADLKGASLKNANLLDANFTNVKNLSISTEEARQRGAIIN